MLLTVFHCQAESYLVVQSGVNEIYTRFSKTLHDELNRYDPQVTLHALDVKQFDTRAKTPAISEYSAIVTIGIEAGLLVSARYPETTTIMAMIPEQSYLRLSGAHQLSCPKKTCQVLYLDQPVKRQLNLLRLISPSLKRIAILSSSESTQLVSTIESTARTLALDTQVIKVADQDSVLDALKRDFGKADVLMVVPDPVVYNRNTARAILLSTFHQKIPLFAYSHSYVKAGATLGLYSTPEDIARHVAEIFTDPTKGKAETTRELYPKYFTIDINRHAAEALGITIPDSDELATKLMQYDEK